MRFLLIFILILLTACSVKSTKIIKSAEILAEDQPERALSILDKALSSEVNVDQKLKYISAIESIIKKKVKKADYYKAILKKKITYLNDPKKINKSLLKIAQLLIQNYRNDIEALNYLEKIKIDLLDEADREKYFKSVLIAYMNNRNYEQALIEVEGFLNRKDLSPSERFKIKVLKARTYADFKKSESAEKEYKELLNKYPNLAKKWKIRTQLALTLEGQRKYKEAILQLKLYSKEATKKDPLLDWRIKELTKRMALQPGGKGRLRR